MRRLPIQLLLPAVALAVAASALPARGQIVSYLDTSGKRIFINANPVPFPKPAARDRAVSSASVSGVPAAPGNATAARETTQTAAIRSNELSDTEVANRQKINEMIREVSDRYRVDPALVRAVIQTESNWNSSAVSSKGAQGLMQLVPTTAQRMGVSDPFDPKQNVDGGVHYLHMLLERYNGDLDRALAAYNAGPGAVDRAGGIPRFRETRDYVQKVTGFYYRPGSDRLPRAFDEPRPIYRTTDTDGRVVFTNE